MVSPGPGTLLALLGIQLAVMVAFTIVMNRHGWWREPRPMTAPAGSISPGFDCRCPFPEVAGAGVFVVVRLATGSPHRLYCDAEPGSGIAHCESAQIGASIVECLCRETPPEFAPEEDLGKTHVFRFTRDRRGDDREIAEVVYPRADSPINFCTCGGSEPVFMTILSEEPSELFCVALVTRTLRCSVPSAARLTHCGCPAALPGPGPAELNHHLVELRGGIVFEHVAGEVSPRALPRLEPGPELDRRGLDAEDFIVAAFRFFYRSAKCRCALLGHGDRMALVSNRPVFFFCLKHRDVAYCYAEQRVEGCMCRHVTQRFPGLNPRPMPPRNITGRLSPGDGVDETTPFGYVSDVQFAGGWERTVTVGRYREGALVDRYMEVALGGSDSHTFFLDRVTSDPVSALTQLEHGGWLSRNILDKQVFDDSDGCRQPLLMG